MRLLPAASLIVAGLTLTACGNLTASVKAVTTNSVVLAEPPNELVQRCPDPQNLPDRALSQNETTRLWARDRVNLVVCRDRHGELVEYYEVRDRQLRDTIINRSGNGSLDDNR